MADHFISYNQVYIVTTTYNYKGYKDLLDLVLCVLKTQEEFHRPKEMGRGFCFPSLFSFSEPTWCRIYLEGPEQVLQEAAGPDWT